MGGGVETEAACMAGNGTAGDGLLSARFACNRSTGGVVWTLIHPATAIAAIDAAAANAMGLCLLEGEGRGASTVGSVANLALTRWVTSTGITSGCAKMSLIRW